MTKNSFKKNAIRERMALTGESYLEASRNLASKTPFTLDALIQQGTLDGEMAVFLRSYLAGERPASFIISGSPGSGKSTMLSALAAEIPENRVVSAISEKPDVFGSIINRAHTYIRTVPEPNSDHQPFSSLRHAISRVIGGHRPDHLVVDEINTPEEILEFLYSASTGHSTSTGMVAQGPHEVINICLETLVDLGRPLKHAREKIAEDIGLIISMEQMTDGSRRCVGIYEVPNHTRNTLGRFPLEPVPLWVFRQVETNEQGKVIGEWVVRNKPSQ
jgi:Flp pilus assembly CpaF family ATPase